MSDQHKSSELPNQTPASISSKKGESRSSRHHKRKLSFQEGGSSPTSQGSLESTAATTTASKQRITIERTPSQFNAAHFDRQSIRSSRSCSNISQRDIVLQECNALALCNLYYPPPHSNQSSCGISGEYALSLPTNTFPPPPPPSLYWYQQYMAPPPPPPFYFMHQQMPLDFETFKQTMKLEKKKMKFESDQSSGTCSHFFCSSVAQVLWMIIALTGFALITALIFALFFV